jgi:hypothetical protein
MRFIDFFTSQAGQAGDQPVRVSYLHSPSQSPGDVLHQKDRQLLSNYDDVMASWRRTPESVLEIGVYWGGSLCMWRMLWEQARVVGVDITLGNVVEPAWRFFRAAGVTCDLLAMPSVEVARYGMFDMIVDDGAHGAESVLSTFKLCWPMVNPGGVYLIEDWHLEAFEPVRTAGTVAASVIGTDHGEHFCDGAFPLDSAERVEVRRRLIAIYKRA